MWGVNYLRATREGVYTDLTVTVRDAAGQEASLHPVTVTAVRPDPAVMAWGNNVNRQLGDGSTTTRYEPVPSTNVTRDFGALAGGTRVGCGIEEGSNDIYCWSSIGGITGVGVAQSGAYEAVSPSGGWTSISSRGHVCAIRNGDLYCWGEGEHGKLGTGNTNSQSLPTLVSAGGWSAVAAGGRHTCGIRYGTMQCWGYIQFGGLGNGDSAEYHTPQTVAGGYSDWTAVSSGTAHSCGIRNGGEMWCWGSNTDARLGRGHTDVPSVTVPAPIADDPGGWNAVASGSDHTCGLRGTEIRCWGGNASGQVGDGTTATRHTASHVVPVAGAVKIAAGYRHTCAIDAGGGLFCWGRGTEGQLGRIAGISNPDPVRAGHGWDWTEFAAGNDFTLAVGQPNGYTEDDFEDVPYDPGRPCGTGGVGMPVCEDDTPGVGDPVWNALWPDPRDNPDRDDDDPWDYFVETNFITTSPQWTGPQAFGSYSHIYHGLTTTGFSVRSMTDGKPFSYWCFQAQQSWSQEWGFSVSAENDGSSSVPVWLRNLDIVPRQSLFSGYPASFTSNNSNPALDYAPTNNRDMCVRWVTGPMERQPGGSIVEEAYLSVYSKNGYNGDDLSQVELFSGQHHRIRIAPSVTCGPGGTLCP